MKKKIIVITILVLALMSYLITQRVISKANLAKAKKIEIIVSVNTALSSQGKITGTMNYTGTVQGINEAVIVSQTGGVATKVNFAMGLHVGEGSVLAVIENSQQNAGIEQAKAQLLAAESNYEKAQIDQGRVEKLYKDNVATKDQYELSNLGVKAALAQLRGAQAALKVSEKQLSDTYIKSTISGVVATKDIDRGSTVGPGTRIARIVDNSKYKIKIMVAESDAARLRQGSEVKVIIDALFGKELSGKINAIGMSAESGMRSYPVEIIIDGKAAPDLKSGMFARCTINSESSPNAVLVPEKAIIQNADGSFSVYVIENGKAFARTIRLGVKSDNKFEVLYGLNPNTKLATEGKERLSDGLPVRENNQ